MLIQINDSLRYLFFPIFCVFFFALSFLLAFEQVHVQTFHSHFPRSSFMFKIFAARSPDRAQLRMNFSLSLLASLSEKLSLSPLTLKCSSHAELRHKSYGITLWKRWKRKKKDENHNKIISDSRRATLSCVCFNVCAIKCSSLSCDENEKSKIP